MEERAPVVVEERVTRAAPVYYEERAPVVVEERMPIRTERVGVVEESVGYPIRSEYVVCRCGGVVGLGILSPSLTHFSTADGHHLD